MTISPPLTPSDCDLRDFQFMPLDVRRLRDSGLATLAEPEAAWAAVLLWCAAWHQVPAASLPDDDRELAALAGYGRVVKEWKRVRESALRNFVMCSDGRLYHPVVAEKAVEAWRRKLDQQWRTECARIKKRNQRTGETITAPTLEAFLAARRPLVPGDIGQMSLRTDADLPGDKDECPANVPREMASTGTGTGTGTYSEDKSSALSDLSSDVDAAAWKGAVELLTGRCGMTEAAARRFFGKLLSDHSLEARDMLPAVAEATVNGTQDPKSYLLARAGYIAKRRDGKGLTPAQKALRSNIQ